MKFLCTLDQSLLKVDKFTWLEVILSDWTCILRIAVAMMKSSVLFKELPICTTLTQTIVFAQSKASSMLSVLSSTTKFIHTVKDMTPKRTSGSRLLIWGCLGQVLLCAHLRTNTCSHLVVAWTKSALLILLRYTTSSVTSGRKLPLLLLTRANGLLATWA